MSESVGNIKNPSCCTSFDAREIHGAREISYVNERRNFVAFSDKGDADGSKPVDHRYQAAEMPRARAVDHAGANHCILRTRDAICQKPLAPLFVPRIMVRECDHWRRFLVGRSPGGDAGYAYRAYEHEPLNALWRKMIDRALHMMDILFCSTSRCVPDLADMIEHVHALHGAGKRLRVPEIALEKRNVFTGKPYGKFGLAQKEAHVMTALKQKVDDAASYISCTACHESFHFVLPKLDKLERRTRILKNYTESTYEKAGSWRVG